MAFINEHIVSNYKFETLKIKGKDVNFGNVLALTLTEGVDHPAIMGEITFKDFEGWIELIEVFAGDEIIIIWKTENSSVIHFVGKIYACEKIEREGMKLTHDVYLKFCSPWFFNAMTMQLSKHYKEKFIHEIIEDLITIAGGTPKNLTDPTGLTKDHQLERFVTPNWTIAHSIKYLTDFAMTKPNNHGGLLIFPEIKTDEVQMATVNDIFDEKFGEHDSKLEFMTANNEYEGSIKNYTVETLYDNIRYVYQGAQDTKFYAFDYDRNEHLKIEKSVTDYDHSHISIYAPILSDFSAKPFQTVKYSNLHPQTRSQTTSNEALKHLVEGKQNTNYSLLFSDFIKINFPLHGSTSRHVGQLVEVFFPSAERLSDNKKDMKQLSGYYFIRNIKHILTPISYVQAITVATDGYNLTEESLIEW